MRYILSLAVLGLVAGAGAPAFAQQQQQQPQSYVYGGQQQNNNSIYNSLGNYRDDINAGAFYNNGANLQMLPMNQMIAGRDAPSYAFGNRQQNQQAGLYGNNGGFGNAMGGLSPDQARQIRAQRDANAQAYQQQYMDSMQQQQMQNNPYAQQNMAGSQYQGSQFSQLYAENAEPKPVKKKVIYNELNNPLKEPPRLFNPDR